MLATRNNISANRVELTVEVSTEEMAGYCRKAAGRISESSKIEGFRPGKAPYDVVRARVGDMAILEEAARIAVSKTIDEAITKNVSEEWIGQPEITLTKLAPDNPFEYRALITLLPSVELGQYKDLDLKAEAVSATDEEVEKMIDQLRDVRVKEAAVDRPAQVGDKMIVDVNLFLDKVPVEGGQAKETAVILGKDYFVPGFDEHVTGMKAGDSREFFLTYPIDHYQKNLAGKKVEFSVTAKQVYSRDLPEVNDEFSAAFGLKSAAELRENIKTSILTEKKQEAEVKFERAMLEKIVAGSTIGELPDSLISQEAHTMLHELERNVKQSGGDFEQYLGSIGKTTAQLQEEFKPQAIERIKTTLALRKIVSAENLNVEENKIDVELEGLKKRYGHEPKALESLSTPAYRRHLESLLLNRKVVAKLAEWNTKKDV